MRLFCKTINVLLQFAHKDYFINKLHSILCKLKADMVGLIKIQIDLQLLPPGRNFATLLLKELHDTSVFSCNSTELLGLRMSLIVSLRQVLTLPA